MKRIIQIDLVLISLNIIVTIILYHFGLLNIWITICGLLFILGIIHFCSYRYMYKPLNDMIAFINELDAKHVTDDDIKHFEEIRISDIYGLNKLSNNVTELLKTLKLGSDTIQHLDYESTHDELTTLCNRTKLDKNICKYSSEAWALSVMFLDVNNLKRMNDVYGHDAGDVLLVKAANQLMYWKAYGDVYRIGGDEFLVVLMNEETTDIESRVVDWYNRLPALNDFETDGFNCELSYGVSTIESDNIDFDKLVDDADAKMYHMKAKLKSC